MSLRFVLVEPREAGNVGAVARVMKNFGFDDLWIVGTHPELLPVAGWWASGADDLLARAQYAPTLQQAIGDAHLVVATTSSRGRAAGVADFSPASLSEHARALTSAQILALVFGREDSGLTREELALCHRTAVIPTSPSFPTMNLAQAAGVFGFALSQVERAVESRQRANAAQVERLHERLEALLLQTGFLQADNPAPIYEEIRALAGRAELDDREVTILLGILRQIEWALRPGR